MASVEKKLQEWSGAGLLSAAQAQAIREYESHRSSRPWAVYGVAGVGVVAVLTGIISLIAANWMDIPDSTKIALYLIFQTGLGWGALRFSRPGPLGELFLLAYGLFFLAGIGLVGQVFNIQSDGWAGLLLWLVLMLPSTLLGRNWLIHHIWVIGLGVTTFIWATAHSWRYSDSLMADALLSVLFAVLAVSTVRKLNFEFRRACLIWSLGIMLFFLLPAVNVMWVVTSESPHTKELMSPLHLLSPWFFLLTFAGINVSRKQKPLMWLSAGLVFLAAWGSLPITVPIHLEKIPAQFVGAIGFLIVATLVSFAAASAGYKRLYDLCTLGIAIRFVVIYFEVFGSLTTTGVGLIITGCFILGVAYAWNRLRKSTRRLMGGSP